MVRKLLSATISAALCTMSVAPAMAQDYRYNGFDAPRGATATLNLRVPLGAQRQEQRRPSYGFTLGYGQTAGAPTLDGTTVRRQVNVADFRFSEDGLSNARVAGLDLANLDRDRRFNNLTGGTSTLWIVVGLVAAGVAICLLADCFEGDEDTPND
jgi:hypothetical protein